MAGANENKTSEDFALASPTAGTVDALTSTRRETPDPISCGRSDRLREGRFSLDNRPTIGAVVVDSVPVVADAHLPNHAVGWIAGQRQLLPWAPSTRGTIEVGIGVDGTCQYNACQARTGGHQRRHCQPHGYSLHNSRVFPDLSLAGHSDAAGTECRPRNSLLGPAPQTDKRQYDIIQ